MQHNLVSTHVIYALRTQPFYPTYCGRVAALYEAFTGFEWWSGRPTQVMRWANFSDRMALAQQMNAE